MDCHDQQTEKDRSKFIVGSPGQDIVNDDHADDGHQLHSLLHCATAHVLLSHGAHHHGPLSFHQLHCVVRGLLSTNELVFSPFFQNSFHFIQLFSFFEILS